MEEGETLDNIDNKKIQLNTNGTFVLKSRNLQKHNQVVWKFSTWEFKS